MDIAAATICVKKKTVLNGNARAIIPMNGYLFQRASPQLPKPEIWPPALLRYFRNMRTYMEEKLIVYELANEKEFK